VGKIVYLSQKSISMKTVETQKVIRKIVKQLDEDEYHGIITI